MKLFLLIQHLNNDYSTYDSVVVCAENKQEARRIHPNKFVITRDGLWIDKVSNEPPTDWVDFKDKDKIKVIYLGEANKDLEKGVILASFNAG